MSGVKGFDKVMRGLRVALETAHPDAVVEFVGRFDEYAITAQTNEIIFSPAYRKMEAIAREVVRMNSAREAIVNTRPDSKRVRVIATGPKGAKQNAK